MYILKLLLLSMTLTGWSQTDTLIDASGAHGRSGSNGATYSTSPGASFSHGSDGGDAGRSTPGADANNISINLNSINRGGQSFVRIYGQVDSSGRVDQNIVLSSETQVSLIARGGDGGDGGNGGDGQGGCNGSDGRDASKTSNGTNGERGCNGGDAGRGTPGSDGGDGGDVRVYIPIEDVHLSLLVQCDVSGGSGGNRSSHGRPGSGGRGGQGGRSHSWSEKTGEKCTSKRIDNGNGSYSTEKTCTPTSTQRSRSGGSNGARGRDGRPALGDTSGGSRGANGTCLFVTEDGGSEYVGNQPFHLQVVSYKVYDENRDGIFEPLERFFIEDIVVRNNGDLPSPSNSADFNLFFKNTNYTSPENQTVTLPRVNPGDTFTLSEVFEFRVQDNHQAGINQRLTLQDSISPQNRVTQIDREQQGFGHVRHFVITYPIEVYAYTLQESAGAGEEIPVFWKIKNNSSFDFGGEQGLRRIVSELSIVGGDADPSLFSFTGENGRSSVLTDSNLMEILSLKANEEILIEGQIQISDQALAYTAIQLGQSLSLENLVGEMRAIQRNALSLRIAQLYRHRANSEFLLITNSSTEREEFVAWQNLQETLNTTIDVWDFSFYGAMSFSRALSVAQGRNFEDLLQKKTIILLNKKGTETREAMSLNEIAEQLSKHQTNLVVIGGDEPALLSQMYDLLSVPFSRQTQVESVDLTQRFWNWMSPKPENLRDLTQTQAQNLMEQDPNSRFFIRPNYTPELIDNGYIWNTYRLGEITYTRTLTPGGGRAAFLPLARHEMTGASYVHSEEVMRALVLTTSFSYKLKALKESTDSMFRLYLRDALLHDLVLEVDLKDVECANTDCDKSAEALRLMAYLKSLHQDSVSSEDIFVLSSLILYIEELDSRALKSELRNLLNDFSKLALIKEGVDSLSDQARQRRRTLVGISKRDNLRNMFTYPAIFRLLTTDSFINTENTIED